MKKLLITVLVLSVAVIAALSFSGDKLLADPIQLPGQNVTASSQPASVDLAPDAGQSQSYTATVIDYDAIYALHDPDEVVMTIDGREITWQDYFFAYYSHAISMERQFQTFQQYGLAMGWQDKADEEGTTYAEMVGTSAEENLRQIVLVETIAEENDVQMNEEEEQLLQEQHQMNVLDYCGENGTDEQLYEHLRAELYVRPEFYWRVMRYSMTAQAIYRELFGTDGEKLPDEQILTWMEENGVVSADHILITTLDMQTGQPLDETTTAQKKELAEKIAEELQAIEDPAEREARFLELKAEYGEDPGAAEGYVFGPGIMITEFYEGALALENGQISGPIQTQYGFHIILRRPLRPDDLILTSSGERSAGSLLASELFSQKMKERYEAQVVEYAPGFEVPNVLDFRVSAVG